MFQLGTGRTGLRSLLPHCHLPSSFLFVCFSFFPIFKLFYCCSITVVCIFSPPFYPTPAKPTSLPCFHPPPWFVHVSFIVVPENPSPHGQNRGGGWRVEVGEGGGFGWGGVERWGENADNCNWTAIKKSLIKKKQYIYINRMTAYWYTKTEKNDKKRKYSLNLNFTFSSKYSNSSFLEFTV